MDELIKRLSAILIERGLTMATAESCTGGRIAAAITACAGSSKWYRGGGVAYSNEAKRDLLGVDWEALQKYGAVSEPIVLEMTAGALRILQADCAVATSGIAGPGGGTLTKPVGTIWIAAATQQQTITTLLTTGSNDRERNAMQATQAALRLLCNLLDASPNEQGLLSHQSHETQ